MEKIVITKLDFDYPENRVFNDILLEGKPLEVRRYLPLEEKVNLVQRVMNMCAGTDTFCNPLQLKVISELEMVLTYSNFAFADELLGEDVYKVCDYLDLTGIMTTVLGTIPESEKNFILSSCWETADKLTNYNNSFMGALHRISEDSAFTNLNLEEILEKIKDPSLGEFMKGFMDSELNLG